MKPASGARLDHPLVQLLSWFPGRTPGVCVGEARDEPADRRYRPTASRQRSPSPHRRGSGPTVCCQCRDYLLTSSTIWSRSTSEVALSRVVNWSLLPWTGRPLHRKHLRDSLWNRCRRPARGDRWLWLSSTTLPADVAMRSVV